MSWKTHCVSVCVWGGGGAVGETRPTGIKQHHIDCLTYVFENGKGRCGEAHPHDKEALI